MTRDGPAAQGFFGPEPLPGIALVPPGDAAALAAAVMRLARDGAPPPAALTEKFAPASLSQAVADLIADPHVGHPQQAARSPGPAADLIEHQKG